MDAKNIVSTMLQGNQLKRTIRTGWARRGVPNPESVAAHTYGVAYIALVLSETVEKEFDLGRLLAMTVLHDLPEALTSDIPTPSWRLMPPGTKEATEQKAMNQALEGAVFGTAWMDLWREYQEQTSAEARLAHDADKLDMFLQAMLYQKQTGNQLLDEFWKASVTFHYRQSQAIYEEIRRLAGL